jgi:hypothetical protein
MHIFVLSLLLILFIIKVILNKFNFYLIDKDNIYSILFSLFLFLFLFSFYFILSFILNFQWDESYIVSINIFCDIYKILTKEQQYYLFYEVYSTIDHTKYDLSKIDYSTAEPYLTNFLHPESFRFESLRFINKYKIDIHKENSSGNPYILVWIILCGIIFFTS